MKLFSRDPYDDEPGGLKRRLANLPAGVRWGALAAVLIAVIFIGWLGYAGLTAKSNLEQARNSAEQSKDALLSGKSEDATRFAENAQFHALQARAATRSLPWNIAAAVPWVGSPLKTTQQISDVVVGLADDVLLPGSTIGAGLSPDKLIDGARIDLKLLRSEQPRLSKLSSAAAKLDADAQAISNPTYLSLIRDARSQLQDQTFKLAQLLRNAAIASELLPSMLGADGPRSYLIAFQNNAEARGTGGILGGFGIVRFDNGRPTVDNLAQNTELWEPQTGIDLGPEFDATYGWMRPTKDLRNANLSPHFPYAAQIWKAMWERRSGTTVDGVIALDPVALSYLLGATGPVMMPDGEVITRDNVVELTESTVYSQFSTDNAARKTYLVEIASAVAQKIAQPIQAPRKLLDALGRAASEQRIAVWSASAADQKLLEETPLGHTVSEDDAPYAQVVINNLAGNKMDYYLRREIEYVADSCDGETRNSTITVRLANTAGGSPLPDYVADSEGLDPRVGLEVPRGTMVSSVRIFATRGARLMSVTANGKRTTAISKVERGHPTFEVQVAIPAGQSGELIFRLVEPTAPGTAQVPVQPLIDDVTPKVSVPTCR